MPDPAVMTLVEFLRARLDEDEQIAWAAASGGRWYYSDGDVVGAHTARHDPVRVLAEVEAKRRVLDLLDVAERHVEQVRREAPDYRMVAAAEVARDALVRVVQALAAPHAGHPDYREEWAP